VATVDAEAEVVAEALKGVGIVVLEEVEEAPLATAAAVVAPQPRLSTEQEFLEESATFIGLLVPAIAHSTARSSTK
jgi:hypothetical protein